MVEPATFPPPDSSHLLLRTPFASERQAAAPTPPPPIPIYVTEISEGEISHEDMPAGNRDPSSARSTVPGVNRYLIVLPTQRAFSTRELLA
jgi:hypothetical protein